MSPRSTRHHLEWMQLLDIEGPFLSLSVLEEVFPDGLDPDDPALVAQARAFFEAWQADPSGDALDVFARSVLEVVLEYEGLVATPAVDEFVATLPGRRTPLRPSLVVRESVEPPLFLVTLYPDARDLGRAVVDDAGNASPIERLRILLHATDRPLGLTTNGRHWALVHAPRVGTTSVAIWETELWFDERLTFRALTSLLGTRRTIGAAADATLAALFERSSHDEREVTNQLGYQVRRSIEVLVHAFDRADDEAGSELFRWIEPRTLYEAAVTVAMRLVFLLAAEARGLLPDDEAWIEAYAVTPLRDQLEESSVAGGEELLERRFDAWARLLATFRAVHGGVEHDRLRLPGYGGGMFDPVRYPFLEGVDDKALRIPNRTILNILDSLQTLEVKVSGGKERRPLSYSALGVEQIGHTYERLLDHTAVRAEAPAVGLIGKKGEEPEVALGELEELGREEGERLVARLVELTTKTEKAIEKALDAEPDDARVARLHAACRGDADLISRVTPLLGVVRDDDFEMPTVFRAGGLYVTKSPGRRSTGTYYTPPSLTEPIVRYALEPIVYRGPAEGMDEVDWELKSPSELLGLKVADIAMGSGAFLVAACRYLADRLVDAWEQTPVERPADLSVDRDEQQRTAKRLVAERCLYGVDKDPLAVEIAKVSLWLETMRKDRPFTFVDHCLRSGDSLLGLTSLDQLEALSLKPEESGSILLDPAREVIRSTVDEVRHVRESIEATDAVDLREAEAKAIALRSAELHLHALKVVGDLVVGAALEEAAGEGKAATVVEAAVVAICEAFSEANSDRRDVLLSQVEVRADNALMTGRVPLEPDPPQPFHWTLEFPEVFGRDNRGFDAIVGNPPFLGGKKISPALGKAYREYVVMAIAGGRRGNADLVAYFFLRVDHLLHSGGGFGLVSTNTIAQGDTREIGLSAMFGHVDIARAIKSRSWPGEAALYVSHVWGRKGRWQGKVVLNDLPVARITSYLDAGTRVAGEPNPLVSNIDMAHIGCIVNGPFDLTPAAAASMIESSRANQQVIRPYLVAKDLNSSPSQQASRWVVDFNDLDLPEASQFELPMAHVERVVRPWRESLENKPRQQRLWWRFEARQPGMRSAVEGMERVLMAARVTKYWSVSWISRSTLPSADLIVFAYSDDGHGAVLTSTFHDAWARKYSGSLKFDLRYSPTDCFQNFPFPEDVSVLDQIGERYLNYRKETLLVENQGPTKIYNRVHEQPEDRSERIEELRRLRRELDRAVADAYGWTGLELDHDFCETPLGLRYTISEAVKTEVLDRLLELNHSRYDEEVTEGLHDGKKGSRKKAAAPKTEDDDGPPLFTDA